MIIIYPEEIKKLFKDIEPWIIGPGEFKEGTPEEIKEKYKKILEFDEECKREAYL